MALACLTVALPVHAAPISILVGSFSFDELIAANLSDPDNPFPGSNAFNINNLTGASADSALGPNASADLVFTSLSLTTFLLPSVGNIPVSLGGLAPGGSLLDESGAPLFGLQHSDTLSFAQARLQGTVGDLLTFYLSDGRLFTASSLEFDVLLLPSVGGFLSPSDLIAIQLDGDAEFPIVPVPEPGSLMLLTGGLSALWLRNRRRQNIRPSTRS